MGSSSSIFPPEEDTELREATDAANLRLIRLVAPTTGTSRLPNVLSGSSGFVYYVSITGITGGAAPDSQEVAAAVTRVSVGDGSARLRRFRRPDP